MGIFGTSISGLSAAQIGLATAQHNIANASTPGFNRQEVLLSVRTAQGFGFGFIGQGVDISTVKRVYSEFLGRQVLQEQGLSSQLSTYYAQIRQIDNMLADPNSGLSPAIQQFFSAVNSVSSNPESLPARQSLLSGANFLTSRFQSLNQRMADLNSSVNSQISYSVTQINSYAKQISALNQNIVNAQSANGQPPNDLMDQRDQLVAQLNKEIKASVVKQTDGSFNVFVGNGQPMVVGATAFNMTTRMSAADPSKLEVAYIYGNGSTATIQQSSLQGGNLGGLLQFRDEALTKSQNDLGRVAMGIAGTFNQQHQLGQDLNGALGGNFFVQPVPQVTSNANNASAAVVTASVASAAGYTALTGSDYSLKFDGTKYSLTRLSDSAIVFNGTAAALLATPVDGLTISIPTTAPVPVAGDSFLIRPTVNGARDIAAAISDSAKIAAATPVRTNAALANLGTGKISAATVSAPLHANLQQAVSIVFNNPATTYSLTSSNATISAGTTVTVSNTANMVVGAPVTGGGFPAGTFITSISNGTTFTTSAAATPTAASAQTLQIGRYPYIPGGVSLSNATIGAPGATAVTVGSVIGAGSTTFTPSATATGTITAGTLTIQVGATTVSVGAITLDGTNNAVNIAAAFQTAYALAGGSASIFSASGGIVTKAADGVITFNVATTGTAANPAAALLTQATLANQTGLTNAQLGIQAITSAQTVTVASTAGMVVGAPVSGGGFPTGTTVISFTATTFVVSASSTLTTPATGLTLQVGNTFNGWTAQLTGSPVAGDVFTVGSNTNATTDGSNSLLLAGLQTQNTMAGGTASYQGAYSQLVSYVGNKTRELEVTSMAQASMVEQSVQALQSVSGVNLDEEAANLLRYQRAYQAAGKAMQIANTMFDTILSIGR